MIQSYPNVLCKILVQPWPHFHGNISPFTFKEKQIFLWLSMIKNLWNFTPVKKKQGSSPSGLVSSHVNRTQSLATMKSHTNQTEVTGMIKKNNVSRRFRKYCQRIFNFIQFHNQFKLERKDAVSLAFLCKGHRTQSKLLCRHCALVSQVSIRISSCQVSASS